MTGVALAREKVAGRPKLKNSTPLWYCPGCGYGIITRVTCEVIEEMGIEDIAIGVAPGGCAGPEGTYIDIDYGHAAHGRAQAVTTGVKRAHPEAVVFNWQGDGDLAAIGMGGFMHAMLRAEKFTTIFLNNAGYGSTGGQMAPTTPAGMRTSTSIYGKDPQTAGFTVHIAELAATMPGVAYSARVSIHSPAHFQRAKKALRRAFEKQNANIGYTLVEFLSPCPPNWGLTPVEAMKFIEERLIPVFPLGVFKDVDSIDYSMPNFYGNK